MSNKEKDEKPEDDDEKEEQEEVVSKDAQNQKAALKSLGADETKVAAVDTAKAAKVRLSLTYLSLCSVF